MQNHILTWALIGCCWSCWMTDIQTCYGQAGKDLKIVQVISDIDQPFLFAYLSWEGKAKVVDGIAEIHGTNNQGGAGVNQSLNLSSFASSSPSLLVRVGPANQMQRLRWMVSDSSGRQAIWDFELPQTSDTWQWLTPIQGASFAMPNAHSDEHPGAPDWNAINQWQFVSDWNGDKAVDLQVDRIAVVEPTKEMLVARAELIRAASEADRAKQEEQDAAQQRYSKISAQSPHWTHTSVMAGNHICLEIEAGKWVPATLERYHPLPADEKTETVEFGEKVISVQRQGATLGWLVGPQREWLSTWEKVEGDPLLEFLADQPDTYAVVSSDDPNYQKPQTPMAVYRKSKPHAWAYGSNEIGVKHTMFLKMAQPLRSGKTYRISTGKLNVQSVKTEFKYDVKTILSPAVHVHQIGYRPDDPQKTAFASCWLGTGGPLNLPKSLRFLLVEEGTGKKVYEGVGKVDFPSTSEERMARNANFNQTDVARLDFSEFKQIGKYRVVVEGFGCSYPFEIREEVWTTAFRTQMRGLYHNRTGMALAKPAADFDKPRDMHPEDGYPTRYTTYRGVEGGGEAWDRIVAGDTGKPAPNAWGGYHDAGDWNPRRVTHMQVTMAMLELYDQYPKHFAQLKWIGEKQTKLPDILEEAVWEFACFRRLQYENGGVGYGLESKGDPAPGEVSWLNSFTTYVLAPDYDASWFYAAVGARLSRLLTPLDSTLAADYLKSAQRAFDFAAQDYAAEKNKGALDGRDQLWLSIDRRNLAALELYRATSDRKYYQKFLEDSVLTNNTASVFQWGVHMQRDHAFAYWMMPENLSEPGLKARAKQQILEQAELAIAYGDDNAFGLTTPDRSKPQFIGFYSTPDATELTRAHRMTGDQRYLAAAVRATQFQAGCNPNNFVYMSGLGANPLRNVFKLDTRQTGQSVPAGLVPYGNVDLRKWNHQGITWPITWHIGKKITPDFYQWPTTEAYLDLGRWPMLEEFTVDAWTPNVLVWGYLSARP